MESYGVKKLIIHSTGGAVWLNPELLWNGDFTPLVTWMQVAATGGVWGRRRFFSAPDSECGVIRTGPFSKTVT
jgi:hypothetical protein